MKNVCLLVALLLHLCMSINTASAELPVTCTVDFQQNHVENKNPLAIQIVEMAQGMALVITRIRITLFPDLP